MTSLLRSNPRAWNRLRKLVLLRDGYQCQIRLNGCLGTATTIDHITSRFDQGSDELTNLQAACNPCNIRKGAASHRAQRFLNSDGLQNAGHRNLSPFFTLPDTY